jgi:hypothetical protein
MEELSQENASYELDDWGSNSSEARDFSLFHHVQTSL